MEYTVQKLSRLAGISARTLRFYDEIGLLRPARISSAGYRIYGSAEVARLQQIMFYRELGVNLEQIKRLISAADFDIMQALREHRLQLLQRREQLDLLLQNVERTLAAQERGINMTDKERFTGFAAKMVAENEAKYGAEVRARYGEAAVARSNQKVMHLSEEELAEAERLNQEMLRLLQQAYATGDAKGEQAMQACDLHRRWLSFFCDDYTREYHAALGEMYVADPRFTAHYDAAQPGLAAFLREAILAYTGISGKME